MTLPTRTDTVVIGAGHAGLAMSWFLGQAGRDHLVLERRRTLGGGWQDRWDEFCLVTPNFSASWPGQPYDGAEPGGFMSRDEIVGRVARYAETVRAPVELETEVVRLSRLGERFRLETTRGDLEADRVVVATGSFHLPRVPALAHDLPTDVDRLHAHDYRREASLAPGGVLVVGSGQSGVQIAEELHERGRAVFLSVGKAGRAPRRYRGRDVFEWLGAIARGGAAFGVTMPTVEQLPDPRAKFAPNPHLSGHAGGHDTNLREFGARGMTLVGRIDGVDGRRLRLAPDLSANLARADGWFGEQMQGLIDRFIAASGADAPPDDRVAIDFEPPAPDELDLDAAGISTVVWTTGYRLDYGWIDLPILDELGYPRHRRGVTDVPGLFFLGLLWQSGQPSATLFGPFVDGPGVARAMGLAVPEGVGAGV